MLKVLMLRGIKMTDAPGHPRPLRPDINISQLNYTGLLPALTTTGLYKG